MTKGLYQRPSVKVPERADPMVKRLFEEMAARHISKRDMEQSAGIGEKTITAWSHGVIPGVANLEACFNVLGLTLQPVPVEAAE